MTKTRMTMVATTVALALVWTLSGCSSLPTSNGQPSGSSEQSEAPAVESEALENYVAAERSQLPAVMDANPGVFSDIVVEAQEPATVAFTYTYAAVMDGAATASNLDGLVSTFQDACDNQVFPAMTQAGVEGDLQVSYTYLNSDGTEIWSKTFSQS